MDEEACKETLFFPLCSYVFVRLRAHVYLPLSLPAGPGPKCTFLRLCANEGALASRALMHGCLDCMCASG